MKLASGALVLYTMAQVGIWCLSLFSRLRLFNKMQDTLKFLFILKLDLDFVLALNGLDANRSGKETGKPLRSVRETEALARLMNGREKAGSAAGKRVPAPPSFKKAAKGLTRFLSAPVRVKTVKGKNKM